ncbi:hypothetical protein OIE82_08960 [Streptomyces althioticus]|jgi:hypothetical protein|uniref:Gliding motility protein n=1 Tax=Streptomyces althioticus TaxID=83380 RepID=A0ABZ1Y3C4_9ACTN|nr:hypothetical protein OG968_09180 [Streptomyces althioticus]WTB95171.1 hypothetical protein OHA53_26615 [Streptomyces althioticus]GGQ79022.1 hypothetical protein GCM10010267_47620 [Streptomyces griseorubens]
MGVFARLFRRSKTTGETAAAEARTDGEKTGAGTDDTAVTPGSETAADEAKAASETPVKESGEAGVTESVDIPKQQSGKAADTEAGEGART